MDALNRNSICVPLVKEENKNVVTMVNVDALDRYKPAMLLLHVALR